MKASLAGEAGEKKACFLRDGGTWPSGWAERVRTNSSWNVPLRKEGWRSGDGKP